MTTAVNESGKPLFGGVPLAPEVKKLLDVFGVPEPDALIPYERIEEVLGRKRDTHRFRSVIASWKRALNREHNRIMRAAQNEGYYALNAPDRVAEVESQTRAGARHLKTGLSIAMRTDEAKLDEVQRARLTHARGLTQRLLEVGRELDRSRALVGRLPPATKPLTAQ